MAIAVANAVRSVVFFKNTDAGGSQNVQSKFAAAALKIRMTSFFREIVTAGGESHIVQRLPPDFTIWKTSMHLRSSTNGVYATS